MQSHIIGIDCAVLLERRVLMGTKNDAQASVFWRCIIDSYPNCARCQWPNRPILAILVLRRSLTILLWLGKKAGVPKRKVGSDNLADHIQNFWVPRGR